MQSLKSYCQNNLLFQEKDPVAASNPDLHFNRAMVSILVSLYSSWHYNTLLKISWKLPKSSLICLYLLVFCKSCITIVHIKPKFCSNKQVYRFQEEYQLCFEGFRNASLYDPGWEDPIKLQAKLIKYLQDVLELSHNKVR